MRLLTDATGAVTDRYDHDSFGNILSQSGSTPNVYLYSGEQNDPNLALYYLRARYYEVSNGRFMTMDVHPGRVQHPISMHRYAFGNDDPVDGIDPSGQEYEETANWFRSWLNKARLTIMGLSINEIVADSGVPDPVDGNQALEQGLEKLRLEVNAANSGVDACTVFAAEALAQFYGIDDYIDSNGLARYRCVDWLPELKEAWPQIGKADDPFALKLAQDWANAGFAVIALSGTPNHAALVIPGKLRWSTAVGTRGWDAAVPRGAWAQKPVGGLLSDAWGPTARANVLLFGAFPGD